jgi:hypothetical protein
VRAITSSPPASEHNPANIAPAADTTLTQAAGAKPH